MTLRRRFALTLLLAALPPLAFGALARQRMMPMRGAALAELSVRPPLTRGVPPVAYVEVALCGWFLLWTIAAAGAVVRRIHQLRAEVLRSVASRYEVPVPEGGDDEIAALARAFNEAGKGARAHLASLDRRDRALRALISDTTHDVAVPITVLRAHLAGMKDRLEGDGVPADDLTAALSEVHYLSSLVHNLGAGAKLTPGAPDPARHLVNLNDVVERVAARHRPLGRSLRVTVEHAVPDDTLEVEGDVTLIEQALTNLVHNAVRYNRPGGHVAVVLDARRTGFSLRVLDDGPGVGDDELLRLSERGFRGEAARRERPEGMGLGLHIVDRVAAIHGFELRFSRPEDGGLEVEMRGPVVAGAFTAAAAAAA